MAEKIACGVCVCTRYAHCTAAVPVLEVALYEDVENRCGKIILPNFRALAASSYAGAWPGRAGNVRKVARVAGQEAKALINEFANDAQMDVVAAQEAISDMSIETLIHCVFHHPACHVIIVRIYSLLIRKNSDQERVDTYSANILQMRDAAHHHMDYELKQFIGQP